MVKSKFLYRSILVISILATCAASGCKGISSIGHLSDACAAAIEDMVTNGYTSPGFNGPAGNNDCTRWGRYWITCIGPPGGPCACALTNPGMGSCALFADPIVNNCLSACGGGVLAANMGTGGNPKIRVWGSQLSEAAGMGLL